MKVLLIGLDGATFSVLDPLVKEGVMPFLGRFMQEGVRAGLRSVIPALTPPAWTSLMTGRQPGQHGIFDFFRMDSPEDRHIRFTTSHDVGCETIWALASRSGRRVTALNFPLMYPAPKISGYIVPGWVPWKVLRLACHPPELFEQLKTIPGFNPRELAMDIKLEEKATEGTVESEYESWVELHTRREQNWYKVYQCLKQKGESDLSAVLFDGVDKMQHLCWRFIDPASAGSLRSEWERKVRSRCLEYYRSLDGLIEKLVEDAGPETDIYIASDHGFGPTSHVFHANAWLEKEGYLAWSKDSGSQDQSALLGVGQVARHTFLLDWERTVAFATTPTSNGIYINVKKADSTSGIPESEYRAFREDLIRKLRGLRDERSGESLIEDVWVREEAFEGPYMHMAPDLTLGLRDGGLISILPSDEIWKPRPAVAGVHRPTGVFMAKGPNIRRGVASEELSILDVMPAMLYSLNLPVPEDLEGHLPEGIFKESVLEKRPVQAGSSTEHRQGDATERPATLSADEEEVVLERLKELGYIE